MASRGNFIVHLGPPKTATTSLQFFFQNRSQDNFLYIGVKQPRTKEQDRFFSMYMEPILNSKSLLSVDLTPLKKMLDQGKSILISEEMLLVDSYRLSWQDKIRRLYNTFSSLNPILLITLREPIKAIESYYKEKYYSIFDTSIKNINDFAKSNYCKIYKYDWLYNFLYKTGFSDIRYIDFVELINNKYMLSDFLFNEDEEIIYIENRNKSAQADQAKRLTLPKLIRYKIKRSFLKYFFPDTILKMILFLFPKIELVGKEINQNLDSEISKQFTLSYKKVCLRSET